MHLLVELQIIETHGTGVKKTPQKYLVNEPPYVLHTEGYKEDYTQKYYPQFVNGTELKEGSCSGMFFIELQKSGRLIQNLPDN